MNKWPEKKTHRIPSKTFLLGEYSVLEHQQALLLTTPPYFTVSFSPEKKQKKPVIHEESPAGLLMREHDLHPAHIEFDDPHQQRGGFGASTAQFLAIEQWIYGTIAIEDKQRLQQLMERYQHCAWQGRGYPPSGADLLAQLQTGCVFIDKNRWQIKQVPWPFDDYALCVLHTGEKMKTHEHLQTLERFNTDELNRSLQQAMDALFTSNIRLFSSAVNASHKALYQQGLVAEHTVLLLQSLYHHNLSVAAKGCGAMGADTLLVLYEKTHESALSRWAEKNNLIKTHTFK